ncbi:MAG: hypothetical protein C0404_00620 [Verrucomicrobia bacterium]|nr:hypothetical protein [Verrucomicrobiota bacterium]
MNSLATLRLRDSLESPEKKRRFNEHVLKSRLFFFGLIELILAERLADERPVRVDAGKLDAANELGSHQTNGRSG